MQPEQPSQGTPALARFGYVPARGEFALARAILGLNPLDPEACALVREAIAGRANPAISRLLCALPKPALAGLDEPARLAIRRLKLKAAARFLQRESDLEILLAALEEAGIAALLLKGYPLARTVYPDESARPFADLDLAVRPDRFEQAASVLARLGWMRHEVTHSLAIGHGTHAFLARAEGRSDVDLHRHVLFFARGDHDDDGFWARAVALRVRGRVALTLAPADHLLHACLHGYRREAVAPTRWMVDAALIIRQGGVDWPTLVGAANSLRCEAVLAACLDLLAERLDAAVPASVLHALRAAPRRPSDEAFFSAWGTGSTPRRLGHRLHRAWLDYARHAGDAATPLGFVRRTLDRWRVTSVGGLGREFVRRLRVR